MSVPHTITAFPSTIQSISTTRRVLAYCIAGTGFYVSLAPYGMSVRGQGDRQGHTRGEIERSSRVHVIAYGATEDRGGVRYRHSVCCYAMSGTDMAYEDIIGA
eukprot:3940456-Rhodomonas_salina.1